MRRKLWGVVVVATLVGACGGGGSKGGTVVARADQEELSAEWVANVIHTAKGMTPNIRLSNYLADIWVDLSLFAQASTSGTLADSTTVADAMWFDLLKFSLLRWHDSVVSERVGLTDAQIDSTAAALDMRLSQHLLIRTSGDKAADAEVLKRIQGLHAQIRGGASFDSLAAEYGEDGTREQGGWLPLASRNSFVAEFTTALWKLAPGELAPLVKTDYGYHIVRRASATVGDSAIRAAARDSLMARYGLGVADSLLSDMSTQRKFTVKADAPTHVKAALQDLAGARKKSTALATFTGGELSMVEFLRWFDVALSSNPMGGADLIEQMRSMPDSALAQLLNEVGRNQMLAEFVIENGITYTPAEWADVHAAYQSGVDSLAAHMGLTSIDPALSGNARKEAAAAKVMEYFQRVQDREVMLEAPPGALTFVLRGRYPFAYFADGLQNSVNLAIAKNAADGGGIPPLQDGMQPTGDPDLIVPAPGGPPVGGNDGNQ